jgi:DNA-binding beta-propeller fold protein YncE
MNAPGALGLDARGNVYFVDTGNSSVRTISAAGQVATLAGAAARFSSPAGLAVQPGPGGTVAAIYVADTGNHTIRVVTPGVPVQVATLAGTAGVAGFQDSSEPGSADGARFNAPAGLALDLQGNLYVADRGNQAIRMIAPDGTVSTVAGNPAAVGADDGGAGLASFNGPSAVAVTVDGSTLYVADTGNHLVRRIQDGSVSTLAGTAGEPGSADGSKDTLLNAPVAIALDNAGNLYVTNNGSSTVCQITPGGTVSTIIGNPALSANVFSPDPLPSLLAHPRGIAVDPATGNIFVSIDDAVMKVDFHP